MVIKTNYIDRWSNKKLGYSIGQIGKLEGFSHQLWDINQWRIGTCCVVNNIYDHICQRMGHMGSWQFKAFKVTSESLYPQENSWLESVWLIGFGTTAWSAKMMWRLGFRPRASPHSSIWHVCPDIPSNQGFSSMLWMTTGTIGAEKLPFWVTGIPMMRALEWFCFQACIMRHHVSTVTPGTL